MVQGIAFPSEWWRIVRAEMFVQIHSAEHPDWLRKPLDGYLPLIYALNRVTNQSLGVLR